MEFESQKSSGKGKRSSFAKDMYSFIRPNFLQKKRSEKKVEASASRIASLHQRIDAEFSHVDPDDMEEIEDDKIAQGDFLDCVTDTSKSNDVVRREKKKKTSKSKAKAIDPFQKSEKKKQLEAFEMERVTKAKEKKRMDRIEKEVSREVEREMSELEALRAQEEDVAKLRQERAEYWTKAAREQQEEVNTYNRFLLAKKEEKLLEKQLGTQAKYAPAARQSYEQWLQADESKRHLYAQAIEEEKLQQHQRQQQQQQHQHQAYPSMMGISSFAQQLGATSGKGGGMGYDASMFAENDDDDGGDELGGTSSKLTAEELDSDVDYELPPSSGVNDRMIGEKGGDGPMTSAEMKLMMQPSQDWMALSREYANDVSMGASRMSAGDYNSDGHGGVTAQTEKLPCKQKPPVSGTVKKESVKSAISAYNASKQKKLLRHTNNSHASSTSAKNLYKSTSMSNDKLMEEAAKVVSDTEMNKMKTDLKIFQVQEELTQLQGKHDELQESVSKIEDTIEKIDTMLYCRECDLDNANEKKSTDSHDADNEELMAQLNTMINKLKQSQKLAEKKKEYLDDQLFIIEKDMKIVSSQLKSLKIPPTTDTSATLGGVRLPDIRNKHSR